MFKNALLHVNHNASCQVSQVLDLDNCPPHNIVHDILQYPNYYSALYYPECFPEFLQHFICESLVRNITLLSFFLLQIMFL